jgi:uncharacterized damage-inducible protein DinB
MKEYFPILSRYNTLANNEMFGVLAGLPEERLHEEVGSYFKSIMGVLNHLLMGDYAWLQRIRDCFPAFVSLKTPAIDVKIDWTADKHIATLSELRAKRTVLDSVFTELTAELDERALAAVIDYVNFSGKRTRYVCWQALMHIFNHQTHHRGQIAEILDQFGVKNDYSNIGRTLIEVPLP